MSIVLLGEVACVLCGQVIREDQPVESFPAFIWNEADPFAEFNDASVHVECLERDPRCRKLRGEISQFLDRTKPASRICAVCCSHISDPDDYIFIPRLTGMKSEAVKPLSYTHLHKSHVSKWQDYDAALLTLNSLAKEWQGDALSRLLVELTSARQS